MKIKTGDKVKILQGKDRGKQGKVAKVFVKANKIIVDGLNLQSKSVRAKRQGEKGQVVQYSAPMNVSNVMLVCPKCSRWTRVGYKKLDQGRQVRRCKKCQNEIE